MIIENLLLNLTQGLIKKTELATEDVTCPDTKDCLFVIKKKFYP